MAQQARFTEQMPFVGTKTQRAIVDREERRGRSRAAVIRDALDARWGLVEGELPEGVTELPDAPVTLSVGALVVDVETDPGDG